jgi:hypothetical protein
MEKSGLNKRQLFWLAVALIFAIAAASLTIYRIDAAHRDAGILHPAFLLFIFISAGASAPRPQLPAAAPVASQRLY